MQPELDIEDHLRKLHRGGWDPESIVGMTADDEFDGWLLEIEADALERAAKEIHWKFETFRAADGQMSIRMHTKSPAELLEERAEFLRKAARE